MRRLQQEHSVPSEAVFDGGQHIALQGNDTLSMWAVNGWLQDEKREGKRRNLVNPQLSSTPAWCLWRVTESPVSSECEVQVRKWGGEAQVREQAVKVAWPREAGPYSLSRGSRRSALGKRVNVVSVSFSIPLTEAGRMGSRTQEWVKTLPRSKKQAVGKLSQISQERREERVGL